MTSLASAAGRSFLRAFFAALVVLSIGVFDAPNLNRIYALGVAALLGAFAAGLRALTAYVPKLSLVALLGHPYGDWADSFLHGFLAALIVTLIGILGAPDLHTARSLAVAGIIGALNAGVRALQGLGTVGEVPFRTFGIPLPKAPYTYALPAPSGEPAPIGTPAASATPPPGP